MNAMASVHRFPVVGVQDGASLAGKDSSEASRTESPV
jgi:hypothetical protein